MVLKYIYFLYVKGLVMVSFEDFKEQYGGNVFIVFSLDGEIANKEVIEQIRAEIEILK